MAKCAACGETILMGGKKEDGQVFCNDKCYRAGILQRGAQDIPINVIEAEVHKVHQGNCPKCGGPGPVDLHMWHQVWSALYLTSHKSQPQLSCQSCGRKRQITACVFSFVLGWWGFPWGFIFTPVQIGRNIAAMVKPPDPTGPSAGLRELVRLTLAQQAMNNAQNQSAAAPPIPAPFANNTPQASTQAPKGVGTPPGDPFSNQDAFKS